MMRKRIAFSGAALWAAFLYVLILLAALALAPQPAIALESPQALVVLLAHGEDPHLRSWRLVSDLEAPVGSETGPAATGMACTIQAATRLATWLSGHMPGWQVREWRCLPVGQVAAFLAAHSSADI